MKDLSETIGDEILNEEHAAKAAKKQKRAPSTEEALPTRYGPYYLLPSYKALAQCAGPRTDGRYKFDTVLLFADSGQLVAASNSHLVVSPIVQVTDMGLTPILDLARSDYELGQCTFALPLELFETLPDALPDGQSHIELIVEYDGSKWVATVQEQPFPQNRRSWTLVGRFPDPQKHGLPTNSGLNTVLGRALEESSRVITVDARILQRICAALGSTVVRVFTHGRTGVLRLEPTGTEPSLIDPFTTHSMGLLMPWSEERDWEHDQRHGVAWTPAR